LPPTSDHDDWAIYEFGAANLGDARRTKRLVALARRLAKSPHCSFPQALPGSELKAAYRFFDNPEVDVDGVLAPHVEQTLARMRQVPVVLAAQDTTEFNLTHLPATDGLGYGSVAYLRGFFLHSLLALTPEGLPLGVLGMKTWARPLEQYGKAHQRKQLAIEEKESAKWLEGLAHLRSLHERCPATRIVGVCDREADIYEMFAAERPNGVDWLIRAAWDRRVAHPEKHLWAAMASAPVLGLMQLPLSRQGNSAQRTAELTIRCAPVHLRSPRSRRCECAPEVMVQAVWAVELRPPEGSEPIEWMLLTSVPTVTYEDALERISWYARRWTIESWHRVLKSGCRIEARQFGSVDRFVRATALFAVVAWRILYATLLSRLDPDICCEAILQPSEWKALYCRTHATNKAPKRPPTLADAILWIGKLGGYLARKHDPPPGPTAIWRGFLSLHEITQMYLILHQIE
jgi:hypothetical protein